MQKLAVGVIFALFTLASSSFGQATDSNLVGTAVDATGAVVPNVTVEVTNTATGVKTTTKTDANGQYRINNLLIGHYDLRASATGFATANVKGLDLELKKTNPAN